MIESEVWKDVPGYEGRYQVSNMGRVKSVVDGSKSNGMVMKARVNKTGKGYLQICLSNPRRKFYVHRLVAMAFLDNHKMYPCINHKDGNSLNNNSENLEWCTYSMNTIHSMYELKNKHSKRVKVVNVETGVEYDSIRSAYQSKSVGVNYSHFSILLRGKFTNNTGFEIKKETV
jgi:hypothetical protein